MNWNSGERIPETVKDDMKIQFLPSLFLLANLAMGKKYEDDI